MYTYICIQKDRVDCLLIRPDNCRWVRAHFVSPLVSPSHTFLQDIYIYIYIPCILLYSLLRITTGDIYIRTHECQKFFSPIQIHQLPSTKWHFYKINV